MAHARVTRLLDCFWPLGRYRDAAVGSELERAAAHRHNCQLARGLPACLNRWLALSCALLMACSVSSGWLAPVAGVAFAVAFCITLHIAHVWLLLSRRESP